MNEDLPNRRDDFAPENQPSEQQWQAPPPPFDNTPVAELPQMSEVGTLGSIFFEPGATFEDLRRKPRFIVATLISVALFAAFIIAFNERIGFERIATERLEASSWYQNQSPEAQAQTLKGQTSPIVKIITYSVAPIVFIVTFFVGGLLYWGGTNAMGGTISYLRSVSVWAYSGFPPTVVSMLANTLILFLKSPDDIDPVASQQGLLQASPAFLINAKTSPVLAAVLGTFDLFYIWGWILAVIGLRIVGKISTGAAFGIVLMIALIFNVGSRVIGALFS